MELLTSDDVRKLLEIFSNTSFKPKDCDKTADTVQHRCVQLFYKDYPQLALIPNENGELSTSYPSKLIVPQQFASGPAEACARQPGAYANPFDANKENEESFATNGGHCFAANIDAGKLRDLMTKARVARCRARFPVPVILVDGKYICRSATLSGGPEIYGRSGLDLLFASNDEEPISDSVSNSTPASYLGSALNGSASGPSVAHSQSQLPSLSSLSLGDSSQVFSKVRNQDINLLKYLSVKYICDLMVEKKKVKFGVNITSSEKADKEGRYADFEILSLPYPGCEFFRDYRDKGYSAEGLVFDWSQHFVDAALVIPKDRLNGDFMEINWTNYKSWDIIKLTRNYLKLLLHYLAESNSSILVHCISGWDRTPLFISLLRLSLWADGKVHQNLSPIEITYLTVAYDWYLFGHNLNDRISKGEEILFFCFYFLKFITSEEFSVDNLKSLCSQTQRRSCNETPRSFEFNLEPTLEDSLLEESCANGQDEGDNGTPTSFYLGSSTSLNSTCSIGSVRSQDAGPPNCFPCEEPSAAFCGFKAGDVPDGLAVNFYPRTPPTLTNSEEGGAFLDAEADDSSIETLISFNGISNGKATKHEKKLEGRSPKPVPVPVGKTTPVEIPSSGSRSNGRGRGTNGADAWQLVSDTGSVREAFSTRGLYNSPESHLSDSSSSNKSKASTTSNGSGSTAQPSKDHSTHGSRGGSSRRTSAPSSSPRLARKEKLQAVRSIFYNAYSAGVGFRFKNGPEAAGFSSMLYQHLGVYSGRITAPH